MAVKLPKGWYDISVPIKQGMIYFPTDPAPPRIYRYSDRALGGLATMCMLEFIGHTGTHLDAPLHFIPDGSTISDMDVEATIGPCRVIDIKDKESIKVAELKQHNIKKGDRIICKTSNSPRTYESPKFQENYVYLDTTAAGYLVEVGVLLFGLDNITIGKYQDPDSIIQTHQKLLGAGIYILENCAMAGVPAGEYELLCLPLLMLGGDAGPSRAILRPMK
jgi:arylformamidase